MRTRTYTLAMVLSAALLSLTSIFPLTYERICFSCLCGLLLVGMIVTGRQALAFLLVGCFAVFGHIVFWATPEGPALRGLVQFRAVLTVAGAVWLLMVLTSHTGRLSLFGLGGVPVLMDLGRFLYLLAPKLRECGEMVHMGYRSQPHAVSQRRPGRLIRAIALPGAFISVLLTQGLSLLADTAEAVFLRKVDLEAILAASAGGPEDAD